MILLHRMIGGGKGKGCLLFFKKKKIYEISIPTICNTMTKICAGPAIIVVPLQSLQDLHDYMH